VCPGADTGAFAEREVDAPVPVVPVDPVFELPPTVGPSVPPTVPWPEEPSEPPPSDPELELVLP
jgi:hypothetical protein